LKHLSNFCYPSLNFEFENAPEVGSMAKNYLKQLYENAYWVSELAKTNVTLSDVNETISHNPSYLVKQSLKTNLLLHNGFARMKDAYIVQRG
jgi:hypothetical protein